MTWPNWRVRDLWHFPVRSSSTVPVHQSCCAGRLTACSATSQVVRASGANWTAFLEAEKLFSVQPVVTHVQQLAMRPVFICQRSISPLRRIVYWPRRAQPRQSLAAPIDAVLSVTHKKQSVLPARTPWTQWAGTSASAYRLCRSTATVVMLLRAMNDDFPHWATERTHRPIHSTFTVSPTGICWRVYHAG